MTLDPNVEESQVEVDGVNMLSMKPSFLSSGGFVPVLLGIITLSPNVCLLADAAFITEVLILQIHMKAWCERRKLTSQTETIK